MKNAFKTKLIKTFEVPTRMRVRYKAHKSKCMATKNIDINSAAHANSALAATYGAAVNIYSRRS